MTVVRGGDALGGGDEQRRTAAELDAMRRRRRLGRAAGQIAPRFTHSVSAAISVILEFSLGGHLHVAVVADRRDQRALVGLAREHDRPAFGPLEHCVCASRAADRPCSFRSHGNRGSG